MKFFKDKGKNLFMRPWILFLSVALLVSISFACSGEATIFVPAVVEDGGSLVSISLQLIEGKGDIYLTTYPNTAVSTQVSTNDAIQYGFSVADRDIDDCDVLVKIGGANVASYVEGPSAGTAFSVLAYSALTGMPILEDSTVTGALTSQGNVEPVGGVYEKVRVAAQNDIRYFVMPSATVHDRVLLIPLKQTYDIEILEVADGIEAIDFLVYGNHPPERDLLTSQSIIPYEMPPYSSVHMESFRSLAERMITLESDAVANLDEDNKDTKAIKSYFQNDIARQQVILEKGYLFTAANEAFLDYVSATTISTADHIADVSLRDRKEEIISCLEGLEEKDKTLENWQWLAAADLRKAWAESRLDSIDPYAASLVEEKYFLYNQMQYAEAWCFVSKELRAIGSSDAGSFDENKLQELALEKLEFIQSIGISTPEGQEHAITAYMLFENGHYAASLYDSTFVISMERADEDGLLLTQEQMNERLDKMVLENRTSLWGKIYHSQGAFLVQSDELSDKFSAYKILSYARGLDDLHVEIDVALASTPQSTQPNLPFPLPDPSSSESVDCSTSYILAFISLSGVILWIRK